MFLNGEDMKAETKTTWREKKVKGFFLRRPVLLNARLTHENYIYFKRWRNGKMIVFSKDLN